MRVHVYLYIYRWWSAAKEFKFTFEEVAPPVPEGWYVSSAWRTVATSVSITSICNSILKSRFILLPTG